jgi:predicted chitinase
MLPVNGKRAMAAANSGDVKALTKAINGGYNGLQDRQNNTKKIFSAVS